MIFSSAENRTAFVLVSVNFHPNVLCISHSATSLQYYFPTRNRAIDWKLLIAGKENLDYLGRVKIFSHFSLQALA